jgi:hypothetical protein
MEDIYFMLLYMCLYSLSSIYNELHFGSFPDRSEEELRLAHCLLIVYHESVLRDEFVSY